MHQSGRRNWLLQQLGTNLRQKGYALLVSLRNTLLTAVAAAVGAVVYVQLLAGLLPVCGHVGLFCHRVVHSHTQTYLVITGGSGR